MRIIKNFNITRLDSKGRILVPFHIRDRLGLKEGTEVLIADNANELKIFPLANNIAEIRIMLNDAPGFLAKILEILDKYNINILMCMSKTLERGKLAEWNSIADIAKCKDIKKMERKLLSMDFIKKVEIKGK